MGRERLEGRGTTTKLHQSWLELPRRAEEEEAPSSRQLRPDFSSLLGAPSRKLGSLLRKAEVSMRSSARHRIRLEGFLKGRMPFCRISSETCEFSLSFRLFSLSLKRRQKKKKKSLIRFLLSSNSTLFYRCGAASRRALDARESKQAQALSAAAVARNEEKRQREERYLRSPATHTFAAGNRSLSLLLHLRRLRLPFETAAETAAPCISITSRSSERRESR